MSDLCEQLRSSGSAEQSDSGTWTAGIDALRSYPYRDTQWHLHAIEFHHKVREEAEALRDRWLAMALSDEIASLQARHSATCAEFNRLQAQLASANATVDVLEKNASVQATLLADTGRQLASARKALREARRFIDHDPTRMKKDVLIGDIKAALTDEKGREYEPGMNPVDDAEFGMKP